jgi:hypothetical protein
MRESLEGVLRGRAKPVELYEGWLRGRPEGTNLRVEEALGVAGFVRAPNNRKLEPPGRGKDELVRTTAVLMEIKEAIEAIKPSQDLAAMHKALPSGWSTQVDKESGNTFYFAGSHSQWEPPTGPPPH